MLALTVSLSLLVFLPIFDTLLMPLFHEPCVALELVDLDAAHFLLTHGSNLLVFVVGARCHSFLVVSF